MRLAATLLLVLAAIVPLAAAESVAIVLLGDSTVATFPESRPIRGWGQCLASQFENASVQNLAASGASSKSFLTSPNWEKAKQAGGDIWLIQFGHNDAPSKGDRATKADGDYKDNLKTMIELARDSTATPVLVTMPYRRNFTQGKTLNESQKPYVEAMKQVGEETGVPVIDLYAKSGRVFLELGPEDSQKLTAPGDNTHFSPEGAEKWAAFVAKELAEKFPQLKKK